jgi:SAM-dependent methyltransferase
MLMSQPPLSDPTAPPDPPTVQWSRRLLAAESAWMQPLLATAGERLLWIVPPGGECSMPDRASVLRLTMAGAALAGDLRARATEWPFDDDAFDGIVMQHPLEAGLAIDRLLDEAVRVLRPESSLWLLASGAATLCRFRLASALGVARWPAAFRPGSMQAVLSRQGCVDIHCASLAFDARRGALQAAARALPWSSVILMHARKRRSATVVRPRALAEAATARLQGMPAPAPASRVGVAA